MLGLQHVDTAQEGKLELDLFESPAPCVHMNVPPLLNTSSTCVEHYAGYSQ